MQDYTLIRSERKTLAIQVKPDGRIIVRAPKRLSDCKIEKFVSDNEEWIHKARIQVMETAKKRRLFTEEDRRAGMEAAANDIPGRVSYFAGRMGVDYGKITIRGQKTRWGSCSSKGNLNFNWKLMLLPENVRDYVVVHELAHRREMNHSAAFWAVVEEELPDYRERQKLLKEWEI